MKNVALVLLCLLIACGAPAAETPGASVAGASGVSADRLRRVRDALQGFVDRHEAAGFVWRVVKDGRPVDEGTVGFLDVEGKVAMRSDAIFRIASMTKPVTSVAIMMLLEEGRVLLTDPLSKYIPAFKTLMVAGANGAPAVPAEREITIRDLLTHRSGLTYGFADSGPVGDAYRSAAVNDGLSTGEGTIADNVARLAALPLAHQPGKAFTYGLSVDVLGRVVEVVSGQPLDAFFRERIFKPLGMNDTDFVVPAEKWSRLTTVYTKDDHGGLRPMKDPETFKNVAMSPTAYYRAPKRYFSGGAGLVSTLEDYAHFCEMLLGGGERRGVRLLGRKSVELMTVAHTRDLPRDSVDLGLDFGLGFSVVTDVGGTQSLGSAGAFGWSGIYGTLFWIDPKEHLYAVLLAQRFPRRGANWDESFSTAVYQALVP